MLSRQQIVRFSASVVRGESANPDITSVEVYSVVPGTVRLVLQEPVERYELEVPQSEWLAELLK